MSIKIYEAYRFPLNKLNEFITHVRPRMLEDFYSKIDRLMQIGVTVDELDEIDKEVASWEHLKDAPSEQIEKAKYWMRWTKLSDKLRSASNSLEKSSLYDVDASWNFWICDELVVYAIPYGQYKHGARELDYVEDYCYWNNTDPPDDMPEEEFYERGEVWDKVCLNDWNGLRLNHVVVDFSSPVPHATLLAQRHLEIL